ncbi:MAG: histidine kinase [Roseiarcus sp.]
MPSLFRFLFVLGLLAALVYGGMVALVTFVRVEPRELTQTIALPKPSK